jgi:transcriptional regulator with XRE-family HTH domain
METKLQDAAHCAGSIKNRHPRKEDSDLGFKIRKIRQDRKMSLDHLATAIGISRQQLRKYELGKNRVSANRLRQIASALNTPLSHIITPEENLESNQEILRLWSSIDDTQYKTAILNLMKIASEKQ